MSEWQTIVGNIGTVYTGSNGFQALRYYYIYINRSKEKHGRAAGESAVLMKDGDIVKEYSGSVDRGD